MQPKNLALFLLVIVLGLCAVVSNNGLLQLQNLNNERDQLRAKSAELDAEIITLQRDIARVERQPLALEQHAREELGLSRPGEIVYIFPKNGR